MSTVSMVTYTLACYVGVHSSMFQRGKPEAHEKTHSLKISLSRKQPGGVAAESVVVGHQHGDWGVELGVGS